jgi:ABC-type sugar transport system ATPase subunit
VIAPPVLEVRDACKRFDAVVALDGVSVDVGPGEVLALLGDNGAGKSTLIKAISGVHRLDSGTISLEGRDITSANATAARAHGIETVYQDLALFDNLPPAANFFAGRELAGPGWLPRGLRFMHRRAMSDRTSDLLDRLQINLPDLDAQVALMSGGQRQAIAVARAVYSDARVILLDEPLAAMGAKESLVILDLIRELKRRGDVSIIMIAHNYAQIVDVCDRVNLLQHGRITYDRAVSETSVNELTDLVASEYRRRA